MSVNLFEKFVVGINLPWIDGQYDHDFGDNMIRKTDVRYVLKPAFPRSKQNFETYLKDISSIGVRVVRLWLFERFEGLTIAPTGHVIDPMTDFFVNLKSACKIAQKYNVKFYFCLMDTWGITSLDLPDDQKRRYAGILNGLIAMPNKRQTLIDAAIDVLSDVDVKKSIWAVDVLNEPEGLEREKILHDRNIDTGITWSHLLAYVDDACSKIKSKTGCLMSCGFQEFGNLKKYKNKLKSAVDFYDFHIYNDTGNLPRCSDLGLDKPCIIGECGQKSIPIDDALHKNVVRNFLQNSKDYGYSGCMMWQYGYKKENEPEVSNLLINRNGMHKPAFDEIKEFIN